MPRSKQRSRWNDLPSSVRAKIEELVRGRVVSAKNCSGGFSPGLASRLRLADGRRYFVKALDADRWPSEVAAYRAEIRATAALPDSSPVPGLIGTFDDNGWTVLAFDCVDGDEPPQPWVEADLKRVLRRLALLAQTPSAGPVSLPRDHPRLGGWAEVASKPDLLASLPERSTWALDNLGYLVDAEAAGLRRAEGDSIVHFDLYPHNILLTDDEVWFVDWPHARLGAPVVDLVILLSSVAATGGDPDPFLVTHPVTAGLRSEDLDGVLAAHAGFLIGSSLTPASPGLEPIVATKLAIGLATLGWLRRRTERTP